RATSAIELDEAHHAAEAVGTALEMSALEPGDEEPLELDDGKPAKAPQRPSRPAAAPRSVVPPPVRAKSQDPGADLDLNITAPIPAPSKRAALVPEPPRAGPGLELDLDTGGP